MPVAGAVIGGVASIAGGALASSGASSAADSAAQASAANNALQQQIYQQNTANETPFMQRGNAAGQTINALLGIAAPTAPTTAVTAQGSTLPPIQGPGGKGPFPPGYMPDGIPDGRNMLIPIPAGQPGSLLTPATTTTTPGLSAAQQAQNAFGAFQNSDGYQFRLNQGLNAVGNNYALRGGLDSGAAMKALNDYGQGMASNEFGNYMGYLQNQQGVGLSAANALAGVGTNYANAVSSNNNNAAQVAGGAAIASGNAWNNALNGLNTSIGQLTRSSYGGGGFDFGPGMAANDATYDSIQNAFPVVLN